MEFTRESSFATLGAKSQVKAKEDFCMSGRLTKVKKSVPTSYETALEQFLMWKRAQGISDQTMKDYREHVNRFFRRYPEASKPEADEALEKSTYDYLGEDGIKPATYNNRLVYLYTFFNWCVDKGMIEDNPLLNFKKRKAEGRVVKLDENVIRELIMLPDASTYTGLRDQALILFFLDTGIRPKEAFALRESDFNLPSIGSRSEAGDGQNEGLTHATLFSRNCQGCI